MNTRTKIGLTGLLAWGALSTSTIQAAPLEKWQWRNPLPTKDALNQVVFAGGRFVAVGQFGTAATSGTGSDWTAARSGTGEHLRGVAYDGETYVVVGERTLLSSRNALTWLDRSDAATGNLQAVTWRKGSFVAVGNSGTILTSSNGTDWSVQPSGVENDLKAVVFGNETFVAVGNGGTIVTSADGKAWNVRSAGGGDLTCVQFANGLFVSGGKGRFLSSRSGATWTSRSIGETATIRAMVTANGTFYAVGDLPDAETAGVLSEGRVFTSTDGVNWTSRFVTRLILNGIAHGNGLFVVACLDGTVLTSTDAVAWTPYWTGTRSSLYEISFLNGRLVATGPGGVIVASPDGKRWVARENLVDNLLKRVAFGNGAYVAVGGASILTSTNGTEWTRSTAGLEGVAANFEGVAYGAGKFVVTGLQNAVMTSPDGITWSKTPTTVTVQGTDLIYANGMFVAAGDVPGVGPAVIPPWPSASQQGSIYTSTDGVSWVDRGAALGFFVHSITHANGTFVAAARTRAILSSDGQTWTAVPIETPDGGIIRLVAGGDGWFVGLGDFGKSYVSRDAIHWTAGPAAPDTGLYDLTYAFGAFWAVGSGGTIVELNVAPSLALNHGAAPEITVEALPSQAVLLEYTEDLKPPRNWKLMEALTFGTEPVRRIDAQAGNARQRFYRAVTATVTQVQVPPQTPGPVLPPDPPPDPPLPPETSEW